MRSLSFSLLLGALGLFFLTVNQSFALGAAAAAAGAPVLTSSKGRVTITKGGVESQGADLLHTVLPPGTIIATGDDGTAGVDIGPGCSLEVQPETQFIVGRSIKDRAVNELGEPIPEVTVTLPVGTIVVKTDPGANAASSEALSLIHLPFGRTWDTVTEYQLREAVYNACKRNPGRAPDIVRAAIQRMKLTGRYPAVGGSGAVHAAPSDGKQILSDGKQALKDVVNDDLRDLAQSLGDAAKEADPAMASQIDQAVADALKGSGTLGTSLVIVTPRGNVAPIVGGTTIVNSTGADPGTSTVTVASVSGMDMVTTTEGQQIPVGAGYVVILRPEGPEYASIDDYPNLPGLGGNKVPLPPVPPPPPLPPIGPKPTPKPTPPPLSP